MTETTTPTQETPVATPVNNTSTVTASPKKGNPVLVIILSILGCCFVLAIIVAVVFGFVVKKAADMGSSTLVENMIEKGTGEDVDVNFDGDKFEFTTDEGSFSTSTELPANFPTDVAVYPGAKVISSFTGKTSADNPVNYVIGLETSDTVGKVSDYYNSQLVRDGWEITGTYDYNETISIVAGKGTRSLVVGAAIYNGKTTVTLTESANNY